MQPQIRASSLRLSTVATSTRQTQKTDFGTVMRSGLMKASNVVNNGLRVAAPYVPGAAVVSAAIAGANDAAGMSSTGSGVRTTASALTTNGATVSSGVGSTSSSANATTGLASTSFSDMMSQTQQMAEFQASYNLQYLQLQEKIQADTRQFNLISNIMKTKHDAAKNALNNVR